ncbi:MAG: ATP-dependent DNA helicase [Desulfobulbaceae bacterium]|nr:ATP-dependent DNA helicase [Desulfobulbaceae bacterium]
MKATDLFDRPNETTAPMADLFGPASYLACALPGYEPRAGQVTMAEAVHRTLSHGGMLAVEAETGIGKTLAYLIPAVLSRRKVVISTGTRTLQDQILDKEIPFIIEHIDPDCSALCVKGRQNYLCRNRWQKLSSASQMHLFGDDADMARINAWLEETETGDRAELPWLPDNSPLWHELSATTAQCLGSLCPENAICFISRLRKKAARARVLIVNHHLFFSDLAVRRMGHAEVLPRYESVIFDEAHHLEDVATRYFGTAFSNFQIQDLVKDIELLAQGGLTDRNREKTVQLARVLAAHGERFTSLLPRKKGRFPLQEAMAQIDDWPGEIDQLHASFASLAKHLAEMTINGEAWMALERRCLALADKLLIITGDQDFSHVYWFERREKSVVLSASPIEVAGELQESLYNETHSLIFTSATLTTGGNFAYVKERLGLPDDTETLSLPSPFDYQHRALLYVPENRFPQPADPAFFQEARDRICAILRSSRGRALVLFTSVRAMETMYQMLADRLPFPLLIQGEAPKAALLEAFRHDTHSVLFAVASFWEGVDIPGESLSCVIIDKLPFEVPSDPVVMARLDKIKDEGGTPFFDFQVPRAVLTLRQGVGRLLRSAGDRGVLAILDVRLFTKQYGATFRKSLPPCPVCRDLPTVEQFFRRPPHHEP